MTFRSSIRFTIIAALLAVSLMSQGPAPDWIKVTDNAGWQPRDSQGEVVFKDELWILGGWFDSFLRGTLVQRISRRHEYSYASPSEFPPRPVAASRCGQCISADRHLMVFLFSC